MNAHDAHQDREANIFAMCLLLPEESVRAEVEKMRKAGKPIDIIDGTAIAELAKTFQVSPTLMTIRLTKLFDLP